MKRLFTILLVCLLGLPLVAQNKGAKKVAILEVVDREGTISYGIKLQLRSSLTAAITQTSGYEGYDRVDMAAIFGEHDFQRTGVVSDDQIKKLGEMSGCDYVLITEAAMIDTNNIVLVAKVVNVTTGRVENSADIMIYANANGIRKGGQELSKQLFVEEVPAADPALSQKLEAELQAEKERIAAEKEKLEQERAEERARIAAEREAEKLRKEAEKIAQEKARAEERERAAAERERAAAERERLAAERKAERERLAAEKRAEQERIAAAKEAEKLRKEAEKIAQAKAKAEAQQRAAAEKEAARAWRLAHPYRDQRVRLLLSGGLCIADRLAYAEPIFPAGDIIIGWQQTPHWFIGAGIGFASFGYNDYWETEDYCGVDGYWDRWSQEKGYYGCYNYEQYGHCYGHNFDCGLDYHGSLYLPLYLNARLYWGKRKFSPYFNAKVGTTYNINAKKISGIFCAPGAGIAVGRFSASIEYQVLAENFEMLDSNGAIDPRSDVYGSFALRVEWAF